jgi:hypothetical protein
MLKGRDILKIKQQLSLNDTIICLGDLVDSGGNLTDENSLNERSV